MYEEKECAVCGKELLVKGNDDGTYDNAAYWGEIEIPTDDAEVVEEYEEDIEGDSFTVVEWSEYRTEEMWECLECTNEVRKDE